MPDNVTIQQPNGKAEFTLKVKPPEDGIDGDSAYFWIYAENHDNESYNHQIWAKTIIDIPKPDLSVLNNEGILNIELIGNEYFANETYMFSVDIFNLGLVEVSNFQVLFRRSIDGGGTINISIVNVSKTLVPGEYINVRHDWLAIEGSHWLSIFVDPNNEIKEMDELTNNGGGLRVNVKPPKPKAIIISDVLVQPSSVMPGQEFKVSGTASYKNYNNNSPVKNADVKIIWNYSLRIKQITKVILK